MSLDSTQNKTTFGAWVAARVRKERDERGWSLEATARKMAEVGCPIASTAILKIETGDPPRKVTVDEYYAFSRIFGLSLEAMALPPELTEDEEIAALAEKVRKAQEAVVGPTSQWLALVEELDRRTQESRVEPSLPPKVFTYLASLDFPSSRDDYVGPFKMVIKKAP